MKNSILFIFAFLLLACNSDNPEEQELSNPDSEELPPMTEDSDITDIYDLDNIEKLSIEITEPHRLRDPSYHQLTSGIFQHPDSTLSFKAKIQLDYIESENPIKPEKIIVEWKSNIDGILFKEPLDNTLESDFTTKLSQNYHTITAEARIQGETVLITQDSLNVSNAIGLELQPTRRSIIFKWTPYSGEDFESYLIYAEDRVPIAEITDLNQTEYEALDLMLGLYLDFQVVVKTKTEVQGKILGSNIINEAPGEFIIIPDMFVKKTIYDHDRQKIYAIVNSSHLTQKNYGLLILDDSGEDLKLINNLSPNLMFNDFDISLDGKYLFLCEWGNDRITRIELNTYEIDSFFIESSGWTMRNIEVGPEYQLFCARGRLYQQSYQLYVVNGINGELISPEYEVLTYGDIEYNPSNHKVYHCNTFDDNKLLQFGLDAGYAVKEKVFDPDVWRPDPFLLVSPDGNYIFWEHFQLDKEMNVIREMENVMACSTNGRYASSISKITDLSDGSTYMDLPNLIFYKNRYDVFSDRNVLITSLAGEHQYGVNQNYTVIARVYLEE